jgi:hypothetical protein
LEVLPPEALKICLNCKSYKKEVAEFIIKLERISFAVFIILIWLPAAIVLIGPQVLKICIDKPIKYAILYFNKAVQKYAPTDNKGAKVVLKAIGSLKPKQNSALIDSWLAKNLATMEEDIE